MKTRPFVLYVTIAMSVLLAASSVHAHPTTLTAGTRVSSNLPAATIIVTNTRNSGPGSLREAILAANESPGETQVAFSIPGEGVHTIQLITPLPTITAPLVIDGLTQSGADCAGWPPALRIELDGSQAGPNTDGLRIAAGQSMIRGLVINRFDGNGIVLNTNPGNVLECNFIGTDATGTVALGNKWNGVRISNSASHLVGGTGPSARNLIAGNRRDGIAVVGQSATSNTISGNFIGTDVTGSVALGNHALGIYIRDAPRNMIGGLVNGAGNVISGNGWEGIYIHLSYAQGNTIVGNYVGTDLTGTRPLGNGDSGIVISEQASANMIGGFIFEARNVISSNGRQGVYIFNSHHNMVIGNYIGIDATCASALGNDGSGVYLDMAPGNTIGGESPEAQNVIGGNGEYGIYLYGTPATGSIFSGNTLGTDVTGAVMLRNGIADIYEEGASPQNMDMAFLPNIG